MVDRDLVTMTELCKLARTSGDAMQTRIRRLHLKPVAWKRISFGKRWRQVGLYPILPELMKTDKARMDEDGWRSMWWLKATLGAQVDDLLKFLEEVKPETREEKWGKSMRIIYRLPDDLQDVGALTQAWDAWRGERRRERKTSGIRKDPAEIEALRAERERRRLEKERQEQLQKEAEEKAWLDSVPDGPVKTLVKLERDMKKMIGTEVTAKVKGEAQEITGKLTFFNILGFGMIVNGWERTFWAGDAELVF